MTLLTKHVYLDSDCEALIQVIGGRVRIRLIEDRLEGVFHILVKEQVGVHVCKHWNKSNFNLLDLMSCAALFPHIVNSQHKRN